MSKQDEGQLTLFPGVSHVNRFPLPGSEEARQMTVTSGMKCSELSRHSGQLGLLVKMLLVSPVWRSKLRTLTWKAEQLTATRERITTTEYYYNRSECCSMKSSKVSVRQVTTSNHLLFRLAVSRLSTSGNESQLWGTPSASDGQGSHGGGQGKSLRTDIYNWKNGLFPTQRANDAEKRGNIANDPRNGLPAAAMWPTPNARDWKNATAQEWDNPGNTRNLNRFIAKKHEGSTAREERLGQLNPDWVEYLMGVPIGWSDIDCDNPIELDYSGEWWPDEPNDLARVASGQKNRANRLKALGNMVVPQQFAPFFQAIAEIERQGETRYDIR